MRCSKASGTGTSASSTSISLSLLLIFTLALSSLSVLAQDDQDSQVSTPTINPTSTHLATTSISPVTTTSSIPLVQATSTLVELSDSITVSANLDSQSSTPAFFHLNAKTSSSSSSTGDSTPVYVTLSLCSGPDIQPYNTTNRTLLEDLELSSEDSKKSTRVRLYVSDSADNTSPGPDNLPSGGGMTGNGIGFAYGGYTTIELRDGADDGVWIGVWPPVDTRGLTGTFGLQVQASTKVLPNILSSSSAIMLDDTDNGRALVSSYNYSIDSPPNLNLFVLPTMGDSSIPSSFNSSLCAISSVWNALGSDPLSEFGQPSINTTQTSRGIVSIPTKPGADLDSIQQRLGKQRKLQFEVSGLQSGTNYTAWMVGSNVTDGVQVTSLYPAIKFLTKSNDNCRLVFDVPFCPNVAYSIPVGPQVSTEDALATINQTVGPNFQNFTTTLSTFPCGDDYFGDYSPVRTCEDCSRAYQDWLCAVTMPRCTDSLSNQSTQSSSPPTSRNLTRSAEAMEMNSDLLPYVANRNGNSRQSYIDNQLQAGSYGELLPCEYTCYYVSMSCPNIMQWTCPTWDVTAQVDYGAFADSDEAGIGEGHNGGAGDDGVRWGGPRRYIATDAFGNTFCNAMGTDIRLRQENSAVSLRSSRVWLTIFSLFIALVPIFSIL